MNYEQDRYRDVFFNIDCRVVISSDRKMSEEDKKKYLDALGPGYQHRSEEVQQEMPYL